MQDLELALLANSFAAIIALPHLLAGAGEHWFLSQQEGFALAESADKCLKSLPDGEDKAKLIEQLAKVAPWLSFAVTLGSVLKPRIAQTMATRAKVETARNDSSRPGTRANQEAGASVPGEGAGAHEDLGSIAVRAASCGLDLE